MSARVRILSDIVVNQIAAGEVVERPVSVVKELVENSIDAGATQLTVVIANGGRSTIEVIDNGSGMSRDDALLAIERFGTSKITAVADLLHISTHGFRGEALPSIASVSRFQMETALSGNIQEQGTVVIVEGGSLKNVERKNIAPGTKITVRQLFFNVPARRKFLRAEATEEGLIRSLLVDFAIAYPQLRLRLVADGDELDSFLPSASFFDRAREMRLGGKRPIVVETKEEMEGGSFSVNAMLTEPIECVSSSGKLHLLVNRRSVRDRLLLKAVREGYGNFLKPGQFPAGVLAVELPASEVDVNVHPQKAEVRFRTPDVIFSKVSGAVSKALAAVRVGGLPMSTSQSTTIANRFPPLHREIQQPEFYYSARLPENKDSQAYSQDHSSVESFVVAERENIQPHDKLDSPALELPKPRALSSMRYVGQLFECYLLLTSDSRVAIVDMHAAHERVMFYQLKKQLLEGHLQSQLLLIPETVEIPADKISVFDRFQDTLAKLGIEAERFGENVVIVRAVPALLSSVSPAHLFADLTALADWEDWGAFVDARWDRVIARLACHRSVRSGRLLKEEEVYALLDSLEKAEVSGYCPHGRPVVKFLTLQDFEVMFGRV